MRFKVSSEPPKQGQLYLVLIDDGTPAGGYSDQSVLSFDQSLLEFVLQPSFSGQLNPAVPVNLPSYTVAQLQEDEEDIVPRTDGAVCFCSDEDGGDCPVYFFNGFWRRFDTNSPITD